MAIHKRLPIGKLGMFGFCAALLIMPRFAAAQCGMMGGGGHDHGDTQEQDEALAAHGIRAAGLKTDEDCAALGKQVRVEN